MSFDEVVGEKLLTASNNNAKAALSAHNRMFQALPNLKVIKSTILKEIK